MLDFSSGCFCFYISSTRKGDNLWSCGLNIPEIYTAESANHCQLILPQPLLCTSQHIQAALTSVVVLDLHMSYLPTYLLHSILNNKTSPLSAIILFQSCLLILFTHLLHETNRSHHPHPRTTGRSGSRTSYDTKVQSTYSAGHPCNWWFLVLLQCMISMILLGRNDVVCYGVAFILPYCLWLCLLEYTLVKPSLRRGMENRENRQRGPRKEGFQNICISTHPWIARGEKNWPGPGARAPKYHMVDCG
ncbi:hypothetical protein BJX61DRAFT_195754 [Aspergillus egyptiacus]|nr:hypothetical protein BJX61DRAFT_195754 [Aspergillus egyptiacus]